MLELTKEERRFAEASAKSCHQFICRRHALIGWFGVALFALGFPVVNLPEWAQRVLGDSGYALLMLSALGLAMSATGKLYEHLQRIEQ